MNSLIERQAEEAKAAREARERENAKNAQERELRHKQNRMNQAAYDECRARWLPLLAHMEEDALMAVLSDAERTLARRVSHRAELKLVVITLDEVRKMPPGRFTAMGTSGLKPTEMRAVLYAIHQASPPSASAMQFGAMLGVKVAQLADFEPAPETVPETAPETAPETTPETAPEPQAMPAEEQAPGTAPPAPAPPP